MKIVVSSNTADPVYGYIRLSTRSQEIGTDAKKRDIERLTAAGCDVILYETGSRSDSGREELLWLLEKIQTSEARKVVFTRLDRITDSSVMLERVITASLESTTHVVSLDDSVDLTTVGGRLQARILVNFARAEVERMSERIKHGWSHVRAKQKAVNAPFGYVIESDRYKLDNEPFLCELSRRTVLSSADVGQIAIEAFFEAQSLRGAIKIINERFGIRRYAHNNKPGKAKGGIIAPRRLGWSPGGFSNWIQNPVLVGNTAYLKRNRDRRIEIPNTHPDQRLMDFGQRAKVLEILKENKRSRGFGKTRAKYPLSGLVYCGECRSVCYSVTGSRGKNLPGYNYYYQCRNWRSRGCSQKTMIRMEACEIEATRALRSRAAAIASMASETAASQQRPEEPLELRKLREELAFYQQAPGDRSLRIVEQLEKEILDFCRQLEPQAEQLNAENIEMLAGIFQDPGYWDSLETSERRTIYRALIEAVVIRDGEVEDIRLNI